MIPSFLQVDAGIAPDLADWVAGHLPSLPSLWENGPLWLHAQSCADARADHAATNAAWHTLTFLPGQTVDFYRPDAHTLVVRSPQGGCRLNTSNNLSLACWGENPRLALHLGIIEAIRSRHGIMLHACGYITPGGTTLTAVVGRSGSGKSTHLLRQLAAGAQAVAEDTLWVDAASSQCTSLDRHVRLLPDNTHAQTAAAAQINASGGAKQLWEISWHRAPANALPLLGSIHCLRQFQAQPLNSLPRLAQVQYLWEAIGQPLLPAARQTHQQWVTAMLAGQAGTTNSVRNA